MNLRHKLMLVGLVALALPWSAWHYLRSTEVFLREGQARALEATAQVMAQVAAQDYRRQPWSSGLYVASARRPLTTDGYADDWDGWRPYFHALGGRATLALAQAGGSLHVLVRVQDPSLSYERPQEAGDHLLLTVVRQGREASYRVATEAPGWVEARFLGQGDPGPAIRGEWQEDLNGYTVELRIPGGADVDALGLAVMDAVPGQAARRVASTGAASAAPLALVRPLADSSLAGLAPGGRVWLVNDQGWVLAGAGDLYGGHAPAEGQRLRDLTYRLLLAPPLDRPYTRAAADLRLDGEEVAAALAGRVGSRWQPAREEATVVASAAVPVMVDGRVVGAVVAEQAGDGLQLLANQAALRLLGTTTLAFAGALGALALFAAWLSRRIRRLRNAAAAAVGVQGAATAEFPLLADRDELGDLARAFAQTMAELRAYTEYLRTLADKLSHELRTPLAVVSSSLDNLGQVALPEAAQPYLERASAGAERLGRILRAMSEANRLEQSLSREEAEWFPLDQLLAGAVEGYRDLDPQRRFVLELPAGDWRLFGSPELLAQLLDKLVDNAMSFTPPGGWIRLALARVPQGLELVVANQGPPLPERMRGHLFDSLVSVRAERGEGAHLGLGLHIVRLIAQFHGGQAQARDLESGEGVEFRVLLRGAGAGDPMGQAVADGPQP